MLPGVLLLVLSKFTLAAVLTPVETVDGEIWDVDQSRLLYLHDDGRPRIRDRSTGIDVPVPAPAVADGPTGYGYLAPRGAIFVADDVLYDWADGNLVDLGAPNSTYSLVVNGAYAIWSDGELLIRRNLQTGVSRTIATTAGNWFNDVTEDGRVVYWTGEGWSGPGDTGPTDYNIFLYDNGVTTRLTSDSYYWNVYPITDGSRVVYRKSERCCSNQHYQVTLLENGVEIPLGPWGVTDASSGRDYQLNSGWVAYTMATDWRMGGPLWLRSPDDQTRRVAEDIAYIEHLSPNGQVTWIDRPTGTRFLWTGGPAAIPLGISSGGGSLWIDGTWHVVNDGVLYEVDLSRDSAGRDNDVAALADVNGNGTPEIAVMTVDSGGRPHVTIKDSGSKEHIGELTFDVAGKVPAGVAGISDLNRNGSSEVALLLVKPDGRGRVHIKDAATGQWINRINALNAEWTALAIASLDVDRDDVSETVILGQKDDGTASAVQIIDTMTGKQVNWIRFPASIRYVDVASLPDSNGNGSPEVAALFALNNLTQRIVIKDAVTDALINVIDSDVYNKSTLGMTSLADINGNGIAELALLLAKPDGRARVWIKDAIDGRWIGKVPAFNSNWQALSISAADAEQVGASSAISVLAIHDDGSRAAVQVKDAVSGAQANWIAFPLP